MRTEPTFDLVAERTVVGALMDRLYVELAGNLEPHLRVIRQVADAGLLAGHFFDQRCRYAFAAINYLLEHDREPTEVAVARVCARGSPEHQGVTLEWLAGVSYDCTTIFGIDWYAAEIVRLAGVRRLRAAGEVIARGGTAEQAAALIEGVTRKTSDDGPIVVRRPKVGPQ